MTAAMSKQVKKEGEQSIEAGSLHDSNEPWFPSALVVEKILPFLDRTTYENVVCLNKEIYQSAKNSSKLPSPWPETLLLKHPSRITCVAFSSSSLALACGCDDGSIFLWKRRNGERKRFLTESNSAFVSVAALSIAFSPDEQYLAVGSVDTSIYIWELGDDFSVMTETPTMLFSDDQRPVHSLSFFPKSNFLASAGHDAFINIWDVATVQHMGTVDHPEKVESIAVSPNGNSLASSTWDGTVRVFDLDSSSDHRTAIVTLTSKQPNVKVLGKGLPLTNVQWSKDGCFVYGLKGFRLRRWEVQSSDDGTCVSGHRINRIHSLALSPTGNRVAYSEGDGTIRLSTLASAYYKADVKRTLCGHSQDCTMAFSPDGRCLASASGDGLLRLWNVL